MSDSKSSSGPWVTLLRWLGLLVLLLGLAGAAFIAFMPSGWLQDRAGAKGSALLGREFAIDGDIDIDWDWTTPAVSLHKVRLANIPGSKEPDMVAIDEVNFQIKIWKLLLAELNLPRLDFIKPKIILEKHSATKKNWDFPLLSGANMASKAVLPEDRTDFPLIGLLSIDNGKIIYRDKPKKLDVTLDLNTAQGGERSGDMYKLSGQGTLQDKPFNVQAEGGSLSMLRDNTALYPLNMAIKMGSTRVKMEGKFVDPVKLTGIDAQLDLRGNDLADLFHLTGIPLPPTPPYQLNGHLQKKNTVWGFQKFKGRVGDSDLSGDLSYDVGGERGFVKADLVSQLLDMDDLSGFIGATPSEGVMSPEQKARAERDKASPRLLPDVPLDLTRLRTADMKVRLKANRIKAPNWPINDLDIGFNLKQGILHLEPLKFGVANGEISGTLVLNGQTDVPLVQSDLTVSRLSLKPFFKDPEFESLASGHFGGRFKVKGRGRSLADILATSDGRITLLMTGGRISLLIIEGAGLDMGEATPLLLGKDKSTDIRCAVTDFKVDNGLLTSEIFVFDTSDSNIAGNARINLKDETIDTEIEVHPKDFSAPTARTPITVTGRLKHPDIGLDPKEIGARTAGAVLLGTFLTPLAAIIPFIELGLGENSDCGALIRQARTSGAKPPSSQPLKKQAPARRKRN